MTERPPPRTIDEYIAGFAPEMRSILQKIRSTIAEAAPQAQEKISYRMPAFTLDGDLIYFAAFSKHIGLYPPVKADARLAKELARYRGEKGNLKLPLDEPIPYQLIGSVVKARIEEQRERAAAKRRVK